MRRVEAIANAAWGARARKVFFIGFLEFPGSNGIRGGFDVMLANPPWERIKLTGKGIFFFFAPLKVMTLPNAANAAARKRKNCGFETDQSRPIWHV